MLIARVYCTEYTINQDSFSLIAKKNSFVSCSPCMTTRINRQRRRPASEQDFLQTINIIFFYERLVNHFKSKLVSI